MPQSRLHRARQSAAVPFPEYDHVILAIGGKEKPRVVRRSRVSRLLIRPDSVFDTHMSVARYTSELAEYERRNRRDRKKPFAGYRGACYADFLPFDIDRGAHGGEVALRDARALAVTLHLQYGVREDQLRYFYSGQKGYHLLLPLALCGVVEPSPLLLQVLLRMALATSTSADVDIDPGVYRALAMLRVPATQHPKSQRWKTELTWHEFSTLAVAEIEHLATGPDPRPRPRQAFPHDLEEVDELVDLYARCAADADDAAARPRPELTRRERATPVDTDAVARIVGPYYAEGHRHYIALYLSGYLCNEGVPVEDAEAVIRAIAHADPDEKSVGRCYDSYACAEAGARPKGYEGLKEELPDDVLRELAALVQLPPDVRVTRNASPFVDEPRPNGKGSDDTERIRTLGDLLADPNALKPPDVVVPYLAWRGRLTIYCAADKAGKTTLLCHAVGAVTQGRYWLGELAPVATVLWYGPDESTADTVRRLHTVQAHPDRTHITIVPAPAPYNLLARATLSPNKPDLIVVDSLEEYARIQEGRAPDNGDAAGWGVVIRPLATLSHECDVAIVVLHHVRRVDGQYRGSGEIAAAADCLLEQRPPDEHEDPRIRRVVGRARWPVSPWAWQRADDDSVCLGTGGAVSLDARILADTQLHGGCTRNAQRARLGVKTEAYLAALKRLIAAGALFDLGGDRKSQLWLPADVPPELLP